MLCLSQLEQQARVINRGKVAGWPLELPLHVKNGCNLREHWAARAKRVKRERSVVGWALVLRAAPTLPCTVTLTRLAPRALDSDNAVAGFKAVRDAIAEWMGINDNDPRVTWRYAQEKAKGYACRIAIEEATP
jgi:hypothetical protein